MPMERISGSFRDPSGFVYSRDGVLYRQVNQSYSDSYDALVDSDLLEKLWKKKLLIAHEEVDIDLAGIPAIAYRVLKPKLIPFVSYPYEWSFSMLKDAALTTLAIELAALDVGMTLKDASAYNIQFVDGHPIFIDTLSFEKRKEGEPWVAYKQFCQHFLAPLALMAKKDVRLNSLMRSFIDGIPLDLASSLLSISSKFSPRMLIHVHAHARSQQKHADSPPPGKKGAKPARHMSELALRGILDSLRATVESLKWKPAGTEWAEYYTFTNYSDDAFKAKHELVERFITVTEPGSVWDLGANNGEFSRISSRRGIPTVAFDIDPAAVEKNYRMIRNDQETCLLPLVQDLTNPSGPIGWATNERDGLIERGPVDLVMALALIHHVAISNNVPLPDLASFLSKICRSLIIEFVPKEDSQVEKLLRSREDIFPDYHLDGFEAAFSRYFSVEKKEGIPGTCRTLYLLLTRRSEE